MLMRRTDYLKKIVMIHYFLIFPNWFVVFVIITATQVFVVDIVVLVVNNMTRQQTDFLVTVTVQSPPCHHSWRPHSPVHSLA